jgi:hypothetical protein
MRGLLAFLNSQFTCIAQYEALDFVTLPTGTYDTSRFHESSFLLAFITRFLFIVYSSYVLCMFQLYVKADYQLRPLEGVFDQNHHHHLIARPRISSFSTYSA